MAKILSYFVSVFEILTFTPKTSDIFSPALMDWPSVLEAASRVKLDPSGGAWSRSGLGPEFGDPAIQYTSWTQTWVMQEYLWKVEVTLQI